MLLLVEELAKGQGYYGRLLESLKEMQKEARQVEIINDWLEEKQVNDIFTLITALES
jgi:5-formyltetrahydrofolate cyclo-ligase